MVALPELVSPSIVALDKAREDAQEPRDGYRVPAGQLGSECERALWYSFRWVSPPKRFEGRMLRLFEDGDLGEKQVIADLRRAGFHVEDRDPKNPEKQIGASFADGHGYLFLDGKITGLIEAPKTVHLLEVKTHKNVKFNAVKKHGVQPQKPEHYAQMMIGMHALQLTRAAYVYKNKDTSEVDLKRIDYVLEEGVALNLKAERVAYSPRPLPKLHEDPNAKAAWNCTYCDHIGVCHQAADPRRNCRTCLHSTPERGGAWKCEKHNRELDREAQLKGCPCHLLIPDLVAGEQIDADIAAGWVEYRMLNGSIWRDTAQGGVS